MKNLILILLIMGSITGFGQSKDEVAVIANTRAVMQAVFHNKDSAKLAALFASDVTYGHSNGKLENREEAIRGAVHNTSIYEAQNMGPVTVWIKDKTGVSRHIFTANEKKADGTVSPLKLQIMMVWVKQKGGWRLLARQAVKVV